MSLPPDPPDEQPPPPPPPMDAEGGECPRCGTHYAPFQEYCLECGLRLPVSRGIIPVLSTAWRRRVPWYPGDWIWPVLAALVIAALATSLAILFTGDNNGPTKTRAATGDSVPTGTSTGGPPPPSGTQTEPTASVPTTAPTAPQPPPPVPSGTLTQWPPGQNGWTIVLASIPQSAGRAAAVSEAKKALGKGITDVGVLNSSQFSSLHSGYFVVFSGVYNSQSEARSALATAKASYPQAYARQIVQ